MPCRSSFAELSRNWLEEFLTAIRYQVEALLAFGGQNDILLSAGMRMFDYSDEVERRARH